MRVKAILCSFLMIFITLCTAAQAPVDYQHRALRKYLKQEGIVDLSLLKEMDIATDKCDLTIHNGRYFYVDDTISTKYDYLYVGRVNSCRSGGCAVSFDESTPGKSEYFDYYILFDKAFAIKTVRVFNYQATHGHEITAKGWLKQFEGYKGEEILIPGKTVDAISGATISVYALCHDLEVRIKQLIKASGLEL